MYTEALLEALEKFYKALDPHISEIEKKNATRLNCKAGCHSCCVDDIEVFGIEAAYIKRHNETLLTTESPHNVGKCAFLTNEGNCRIYLQRPYVCRTHGLPLRWIEDQTEFRDICPLNEDGEPVELLSHESCFSMHVWEKALAQLQLCADKGKLERQKLRLLFKETIQS